jgi:hypothetical protein
MNSIINNNRVDDKGATNATKFDVSSQFCPLKNVDAHEQLFGLEQNPFALNLMKYIIYNYRLMYYLHQLHYMNMNYKMVHEIHFCNNMNIHWREHWYNL